MVALFQRVGWSPVIGDPNFISWIIASCYLAAALLCVRRIGIISSRPRNAGDRLQLLFWFLLASSMLFLGINKELDLQTLMFMVGKKLAHRQGWYDSRILIQVVFVLILGMAGLCAFFLAFALNAGHPDPAPVMALRGILILGIFIFGRAIRFNHIDGLCGLSLERDVINHVLEFTGIGFISWSAASPRRS
jgi:hypothetical protein